MKNNKHIIYSMRCDACHTQVQSTSKYELWVKMLKHHLTACRQIRIAKYKNELTRLGQYIKQYEDYIIILPGGGNVYKCRSCGHESLFAGNIVIHMRQHNFFNQLGDK